jgi:hypothetical protein
MRYAVYFCPTAGSELDVFGREWLATEAIPGIEPARMNVLLADVRRYGWHATLSAPFALAEGVSFEDLRESAVKIAQHYHAFDLPLKLDRLAGFLALRPSQDETAINALAERCVRDLNALRAPLSEAAWRRRADGLDERERDLFQHFGYPYVLERYRFHMTLSAPTTQHEEQVLCTWLSSRLTKLPLARVDALTLCRERAPGHDFEPLQRIPLNKGYKA